VTRVERYLAHLDGLAGGAEPEFFPVDSTHDGLAKVVAIVYRDLPEPGMLTALTYGLSLADHPTWRLGKPELCISVTSADVAWGLATAFLAERLRGECPFGYGDAVSLGEPAADESAMTDFLVFAPAVLEQEDFLDIDVGDDLPINISGFYPIHESERVFIEANGLDAFWQLDWDLYDVRRGPAA
jgi:hypothetical protein